MPQAANIVIDNGAGTPVPKTFELQAPAAGDGSYANWRLKEGAIPLAFPRIAVMARQGGGSRKANVKFQMPSSYVDSVTGQTTVGPAFDFDVNVTVPDAFPEALRNDAAAFATNMIADVIIKAVIRDAWPTT